MDSQINNSQEGKVNFKTSDVVTRNSYNNDIVFRIEDIDNNVASLKGINARLCADAPLSDLRIYQNELGTLDELYNPKEVGETVNKILKLRKNNSK